jgi:hypothetical protein
VLVIDADDDETKNTLGEMTQSLMAAARAREITFGDARTDTTIPGVRIDIVPEEKAAS